MEKKTHIYCTCVSCNNCCVSFVFIYITSRSSCNRASRTAQRRPQSVFYDFILTSEPRCDTRWRIWKTRISIRMAFSQMESAEKRKMFAVFVCLFEWHWSHLLSEWRATHLSSLTVFHFYHKWRVTVKNGCENKIMRNKH